jgi:hypothetical protein
VCCQVEVSATWRKWTPNNASKWQMEFNSAFKGLSTQVHTRYHGRIRLCGGLKFIQFLGAIFKKKNTKLRIRNYVRTRIFISNKKSQQTAYFKQASPATNITKSKITTFFTNCLTHLYNTLFPHIFWTPYPFDRLFVSLL